MASVAALIGVIVVIVALGGAAWLKWRHGAALPTRPAIPPEHRVALATRLGRLLGRLPGRAPMVAEELPPLAASAVVEAALLSGDARAALSAAEAAVAQDPADARAYVLLARALFAGDALGPAQGAIGRARELGADAPLLDHLEGRVGQLLWLRRVNPGRPEVQRTLTPPLATPFDRFLVDLVHRRRVAGAGPLWLTGRQDAASASEALAVPPEALGALLRQHAETNVRSLELLLGAAERTPGAPDFVYHVARRALQCGFLHEGTALMNGLVPLAEGLAERDAFARDRAELAGAPRRPGDPATARRAPGLRILK